MAFIPYADPGTILSGTDPLVAAQRGQNLAAGQFQLGQQKLQADQQRQLRDVFASADTSTPEGQADLVRQVGRIDPEAAMNLRSTFAAEGMKQKQFEGQQKLQEAQIGEQKSLTGLHTAQTQTENQNTFAGFQQDLHPLIQDLQSSVPLFKNLPTNSPEYRRLMDEQNAKIDRWSGMMRTKYAGNSQIAAALDKMDQHDWQTPEQMSGDLTRVQGVMTKAQQAAPTTRNVIQGQNEQTEQWDAAQGKFVPIGQPGPRFGKQVPDININQPAPGNFSKSGEEFLKTLPPDQQTLVKKVANYEINPQSLSTKGGHRERILEQASQYNPQYDQTQFGARNAVRRDFTSGKSANNITAINTAIGHMGTLQAAADALDSGSVQAMNSFVQTARTQTGDPKVNNFEVARQAVGNELMRVFRQVGASETETKDFEDRFKAKMSPAQLRGAIKTAAELLESRINALGDQWDRGMGSKDQMPQIVSPHSRQVLDSLEKGAGTSASGGLSAEDRALINKYAR